VCSATLYDLVGPALAMTPNHSFAILTRSRRDHQQRLSAIAFAIVKHHMPMSQVPGKRHRISTEGRGGLLCTSAMQQVEIGLVDEIGMVPIRRILDLQLPVAVIVVLVNAGACVDFALG
jgi:hypothetical protein